MRKPQIIVLSYNAKRYDAMQNTKRFLSGIKEKCVSTKVKATKLLKSEKITDLANFCFKNKIVKTVCTSLLIFAAVSLVMHGISQPMLQMLVYIDCAMDALHIPGLGPEYTTLTPAVFTLAENNSVAGLFPELEKLGMYIVRGFQGLGMVACLIGCFKEITESAFNGDKKDIGGTIFRYAILVACFYLIPVFFNEIKRKLASASLSYIVPKTLLKLCA